MKTIVRPVHVVPLNVRIEDPNFTLLQGVIKYKFKVTIPLSSVVGSIWEVSVIFGVLVWRENMLDC